MNRCRRVWVSVFPVCAVALFICGCSHQKGPDSRFRITSHTAAGSEEAYYQNFDEGTFYTTQTGEYQIKLQSEEPIKSFGREVLSQKLDITVFWQAVPGKTFADSSQINAQLDYYMKVSDASWSQVISESPRQMMRYTGAGFVTFSLDHHTGQMEGTVEHAMLEPVESQEGTDMGKLIIRGVFGAVRKETPGEEKVTNSR